MIRVTADDVGIGTRQDEAVVELAEGGSLNAVSIMVTGEPLASGLVDRLEAIAGLSIGLHLNLTDGKSVSESREVETLVGTDGRFIGLAKLQRKWLTLRLQPSHLREEVRQQIRLFQDRFPRMDHVDTHRHVHQIPLIANALANIVPSGTRVRNLKRLWISTGSVAKRRPRIRIVLENFLKSRSAFAFRTAGLPMEDGLVTPEPTIRANSLKAVFEWIQVVKRIPPGKWELNFHPGWNDSELELLKDVDFRQAWQRHA